jgi:DNA-binding sugar fermentation-stimulating protein
LIEADGTLVGVETAVANRLVEDARAARAIAPRSGDARRRRELAARVAIGERAVMIYVVRRGDRTSSGLAHDIDPA